MSSHCKKCDYIGPSNVDIMAHHRSVHPKQPGNGSVQYIDLTKRQYNRKPPGPDGETRAISQCVEAIESAKLEPAASARVLIYLNERYGAAPDGE